MTIHDSLTQSAAGVVHELGPGRSGHPAGLLVVVVIIVIVVVVVLVVRRRRKQRDDRDE